jgi:hypothetical protein
MLMARTERKKADTTSIPEEPIGKTETTKNGITVNPTAPPVSPYAKTQAGGRGSSVFSQSPKAVSQSPSSKAQPESFTYATTRSGNTFVIPSNLSNQARQYYATLGIATSSQPPTEASFAVDSDTKVVVENEQLANWQNPNAIEIDVQPDTKVGITQEPVDAQIGNGHYTPNGIPKGDESTANSVHLTANSSGGENPIVAQADPNWAMGQNLYTGFGSDSLAILDGTANKQELIRDGQYMTQQNQNVVPRSIYQPFAQNGANSTTAMMDNFKESFGKITSSKYFPFIVLGFVGLIVLSFLRGGKSSGGGGGGSSTGSAPRVNITRYG